MKEERAKGEKRGGEWGREGERGRRERGRDGNKHWEAASLPDTNTDTKYVT